MCSEPLKFYGGVWHVLIYSLDRNPHSQRVPGLCSLSRWTQWHGDFPGVPVVKTSASNTRGVAGWRAKMPRASPPKNQNIHNRSNIVTKTNTHFRKGSHTKKSWNKEKLTTRLPIVKTDIWWCKTIKLKHLFAYLRIVKFFIVRSAKSIFKVDRGYLSLFMVFVWWIKFCALKI